MYTSDELQKFPEPFDKIFSAMENDIMIDIINRIKENDAISRTADWRIYRLVQLGETMEEIESIIQEALGLSSLELQLLYQDLLKEGYARDESLYRAVGQRFIPYEENEPLQQLIQGIEKQTMGEFKNITQTTGFAVKQPSGKMVAKPMKQYLQDVLDEAIMHSLNGTYDYNAIIKKVVAEMTNSGIRSIDYESGVSNRIEVAARRAIVTGLNQVTNRIAEDNMEKLDTKYVETSWHSTARPTHQVWQGRVFYWDKVNPMAESTVEGEHYKSFIKETGYGTVEGLSGANCRHTFYEFIPGISERKFTDEELDRMNAEENRKREYNGKEYTKYQATQEQRRLERVMRKQRQDIKLLKESGMSDESEEVISARCRYRKTSAKYKDFSAKMELKEQRQRVYVDGLKDIGKGKYAKKESAITNNNTSPQDSVEKKSCEDVTEQYLKDAKPREGTILLDAGAKESDTEICKWLYSKFGGNIHCLVENAQIGKMPDCKWNDCYWEFKEPTTEKAIETRMKKGLRQLAETLKRENNSDGERGLVIDISKIDISEEKAVDKIRREMIGRCHHKTDVIIKSGEELCKVLRIK